MEKDQIDPRLQEYEAWKNIITSKDWSVFLTFMSKHRQYLKDQIVLAIGQKKMEDAIRYEAKYEDANIIMTNIETRIFELKKLLKGVNK